MPGDDHSILTSTPISIVLEYFDDDKKAEEVVTHLKEMLPSNALHSNTRWANELKTKYRITSPERLREQFKKEYGLVVNDIELLNAFNAVKALVDIRVTNRAEEEADPLFSFHETALILIIYKRDVEAFIKFLKNKALEEISTVIQDSIFKEAVFYRVYLDFVKEFREPLKQRLTTEDHLQLITHYESPLWVMQQRRNLKMEKFLELIIIITMIFSEIVSIHGVYLVMLFVPAGLWGFLVSYALTGYWAAEREIQAEMKEVLKTSQDPLDNAKIKQRYQKKIYENALEILRFNNLSVTDDDKVLYKKQIYYAKITTIAFAFVFILAWLIIFLALGFKQSLLFVFLFAGTQFLVLLMLSFINESIPIFLSGIIKYKFLHAEELWLAANAEVERLESQPKEDKYDLSDLAPRRYSLTNINLNIEQSFPSNAHQALFYVSPGRGDDDSSIDDEKRSLLGSSR